MRAAGFLPAALLFWCCGIMERLLGQVVKLADTQDLGSCGAILAGSSPALPTLFCVLMFPFGTAHALISQGFCAISPFFCLAMFPRVSCGFVTRTMSKTMSSQKTVSTRLPPLSHKALARFSPRDTMQNRHTPCGVAVRLAGLEIGLSPKK